MAEGGYENYAFDPYDPSLDDRDKDNNDDDDNEDEQDNDETTSFWPGSASTQGPSGEEIEMQTRHREKRSGLPDDSYEETHFGGGTQSMGAKAWSSAKELFPDRGSSDLDVFYNTKGKLQVKMFGSGKKTYDLMTEKGKRGSRDFQINPRLQKK